MKKLAFLILLLCPVSVWSQGMRFDNFVIKPLPTGGLTAVSGALITVCTSAGTGTPCTPKVANIYSDEALTVPIVGTGGAGTTNSDSGGNFGFYAAPGSYIVTVTGAGITSYTIKLVLPLGTASSNVVTGTNTYTNVNNILWVGPGNYASIAAAVTAAGASKTLIIIKGDYAGGECPAAVSNNIQYMDWRGGNIICTQNSVTMNSIDASGVNALQRAVHLLKAATLPATGSPVSYYDETYLDNINFNGSQADGGSSDIGFFGAQSGTLSRASGNEINVALFGTASGNASTGGTITEAAGGHGFVTTLAGSTTAINIATGFEGVGCSTIAGSIPQQCIGLFARAQTTGAGGKASNRNYSLVGEGVNLAMYDVNAVGGARAGWDFENAAHNTFPVLFNDPSNNIILKGTSAGGIFLEDNAGLNLLGASPGSLVAYATFFPATLNNIDLGARSNPFRNACLGTAATNNFCTSVAATTAARTINLWDFGANGPSTQNYPGLTILTSQYTNSTTGMTNVTGGNTLQFPVLASTTYTAECHLYYQAAATGGLNIQFTGPAAPTTVIYGLTLPVAANTTAPNNFVATAFSTSLGVAVTTAATNFDAVVSLSLINGANAGTVTLQAKSSAAVQLQIQAGSFCKVQ